MLVQLARRGRARPRPPSRTTSTPARSTLIERFFWGFTDDYLELVKERAYGSLGPGAAGPRSARCGWRSRSSLRLFAPFLPYVTEEVWSWWREGSVHRAAWPDPKELEAASADPAEYEVAAAVLGEVRKDEGAREASRSARPVRPRRRPRHPGASEAAPGVERDVREAGNDPRVRVRRSRPSPRSRSQLAPPET